MEIMDLVILVSTTIVVLVFVYILSDALKVGDKVSMTVAILGTLLILLVSGIGY